MNKSIAGGNLEVLRVPGVGGYLCAASRTASPSATETEPEPQITGRYAAGIETTILNPLSDPAWDRSASGHPDFTIFHGSAWARVLCKTYGHEPLYLRCARAGDPMALIPAMEVRSPWTGCRGICLPFSDFCSPLLFPGAEPELVQDQLNALARERGWKYFEVRGGGVFPPSAKPAVSFYSHILSLQGGLDAIFGRFKSSVRRAIRKAEGSGLRVEITRSQEAMSEFFRLQCLTRKRHGLPPQSRAFFLNIQKEIIEPGLGFIALVTRQARPVAALVFFHLGKTAIYKFGASDKSLQEFRGNNLAFWEAIKVLVADGAEQLHFGRTSFDQEGVRRFKLTWGTQEGLMDYFKFDLGTEAWSQRRDHTSGLHTELFRRLPVVLNRVAGAIIYPHFD